MSKKSSMATQKTIPTGQSVESFLQKVPDDQTRTDCFTLISLMKKITGLDPQMWGPAIIGFGKYHYKYASGHEGEICITGFSPRKNSLSLYVLAGAPGEAALLKKLGKHKAGKGCLYIKKLDETDLTILEALIRESVDFLKKKFGTKKN
jgi:Domain of unknown function (DU1801)